MNATTIRLTFAQGDSLAVRNELFRAEVLKFEPRPAVLLLRTGYEPLPLNEAGNADVMFCEAIQLTGKLKPTAAIVLLS